MVRIFIDNSVGFGVIVGKEGNIYIVVINYYVIENNLNKFYLIMSGDGIIY